MGMRAATKEITKDWGANYVKTRRFHTKSAGAQEAHEAIRPTEFHKHSITGDSGQKRLYELIWKRTIASQMAEAQLEKTEAIINLSKSKESLVARGEPRIRRIQLISRIRHAERLENPSREKRAQTFAADLFHHAPEENEASVAV